jgi:hypothetical protein
MAAWGELKRGRGKVKGKYSLPNMGGLEHAREAKPFWKDTFSV